MALRVATLLALLAVASPAALAANSGSGSGSGRAGQLVEITVTDATIAAFPEFTPVAGQETVKLSTTDYIRFSNGKSNVQSLWDFAAGVSFLDDADGATSTTTVSFQGATTTLSDLVYLSPSSSGTFLPWKVVTGADLTSEGAVGWVSPAACGTMVYQGSFSVPGYDSAGAAQAAATRYYRVCDSGTELYLGTSRDLSSADYASIYTATSAGGSASAANYEVTIAGADYIFHSAASATTVTLRQGAHVARGASQQTSDVYLLLKFPDGFPAGTLTATVTATATDIVS